MYALIYVYMCFRNLTITTTANLNFNFNIHKATHEQINKLISAHKIQIYIYIHIHIHKNVNICMY